MKHTAEEYMNNKRSVCSYKITTRRTRKGPYIDPQNVKGEDFLYKNERVSNLPVRRNGSIAFFGAMEDAHVKAEGNVYVFERMKDAHVKAEGNVYVFGDVCGYSSISAGGHIYVEGCVRRIGSLSAKRNVVITENFSEGSVRGHNIIIGGIVSREVTITAKNDLYLGDHFSGRAVVGGEILLNGSCLLYSSLKAGKDIRVNGEIRFDAEAIAGGRVYYEKRGSRCIISSQETPSEVSRLLALTL